MLHQLQRPEGTSQGHVWSCKQLLLPQRCHSIMLRPAHDIAIAGYLGIKKARICLAVLAWSLHCHSLLLPHMTTCDYYCPALMLARLQKNSWHSLPEWKGPMLCPMLCQPCLVRSTGCCRSDKFTVHHTTHSLTG